MFFQAVEKLAKRLLDFPEMGSLFELEDIELKGLRVFIVPTFRKYLVFYRIEDESIQVVRVIHGARDIPTILKG